MELQNENRTYSYHTFLFPFLWNCAALEDFCKVLDQGNRWVETSWKNGEIPIEYARAEWIQNYAAYQYFTDAANAAIFNTREDDVVKCYAYRHDGKPIKDNGTYIICKNQMEYRLNINDIRMQIYNTGVAVLILELGNQQTESLDEINQINEYGRRIRMPFLVCSDDNSHPLCADSIEIEFNKRTFAKETYQLTTQKLNLEFSKMQRNIDFNYVMQPIRKLIDGIGKENPNQNGYQVVTDKSKADNEKKFYIKPCVDDRMFVCCLVENEALSKEIKGIGLDEDSFLQGWDKRMVSGDEKVLDADGNSHAGYMQGWADETYLSNRLYKLLYIENSVSCQNTHMKRDLLRESVCCRWLDAGTLHGITHHSLICVTYGDRHVIHAALTLYTQLAILVLAQRSTILALSSEAADIAAALKGNYDVKSKLSEKELKPSDEAGGSINKIEELQMKYIRAQNQLFLAEVTVQEQGVEIYEMLKKQLYIYKNSQALEVQMENLREIANLCNDRMERKADKASAERDRELNRKMIIWSLTLAGLAVVEPIGALFCWEENTLCIAIIIVMLFALFGYPFLNRKCQKRKKQ